MSLWGLVTIKDPVQRFRRCLVKHTSSYDHVMISLSAIRRLEKDCESWGRGGGRWRVKLCLLLHERCDVMWSRFVTSLLHLLASYLHKRYIKASPFNQEVIYLAKNYCLQDEEVACC